MIKLNFCLKSIGLVLLIALLTVPNIEAGKIQLSEGTEVKVSFGLDQKLTSARLMKDLPLPIVLAEAVVIGGKTVIEEGAVGQAKILELKPASKAGKPGYLKIGFVELEPKGEYETAEGAKIPLTGEIEAKGKGRKLLSYLFIFGLFIKGSQAELPAGEIYTAKVAENIMLESE
ncbi:MAG: hypothetical protein JSU69_03550 [Candidatus Zixiibacteriota bacterium]|nr:MAG: hypothetical protein JSU69_03550 [candidate division Zixibacteria bacterium]